MTWIEGFGDEVPIFFVLAAIVIVGFMVLAWKSTEVPEPNLPITPIARLTFTVTPVTAPRVEVPPEPPEGETPNQEEAHLPINPDLILGHQASETVNESSDRPAEDEVNEGSSVIASGEQQDATGLRKRPAPASNQESLCVRLKYMDDTQRTVESLPTSTLGEFKRDHFRNELAANKVIKLIFNGQVLNDESSTLSQLGLENNCVVHCLVHQPRPTNNPAAASGGSSLPQHTSRPEDGHPTLRQTGQQHQQQSTQQQQSAAEAGIDIGGLLVPLCGVILGLVWYCRIAYAAHFTAAATTALVGLSGICIFGILIIWYPIALDT